MGFILGCICGVAAALAVRGILLGITPHSHPAQAQRHRGKTPPEQDAFLRAFRSAL